ncbi:unnamed protein product, partial [Prorocentrum cordatum]
ALWPDSMAEKLGRFCVRKKQTIRYFRSHAREVTRNFDEACKLVDKCRGLYVIVIVARVPPISTGTHAMAGVRWCLDGTLACLNSWGSDEEVYEFVTVSSFVSAYSTDVVVSRRFKPSQYE